MSPNDNDNCDNDDDGNNNTIQSSVARLYNKTTRKPRNSQESYKNMGAFYLCIF